MWPCPLLVLGGVVELVCAQGKKELRKKVGTGRLTKLYQVCCMFHSAGRLLTEVSDHGRSIVDPLGSLDHYLDTIICLPQQCHVIRELRISKLLHGSQQKSLLLSIAFQQTRFLWLLRSLHHNRRGSNPLWGLFNGRRKFRGIVTCLTLLALGCRSGWGRGS